jgi:hypothetical protein
VSTAAVGPATVVGPDSRRVWHTLRLPLAIAVIVVVGAVVIGLSQRGVVRGELDPDAVDPAGSHALAVLLGNHGVAVRRVSTVDAAAAGGGTAGVLVAFPERLAPGDLRRLAGIAARLILVDPDSISLREASTLVLAGGTNQVQTRDPGCSDAAAQAAGAATVGGTAYLLAPGSDGSSCYAGSLVVTRTVGGGPLVVFGTGQPLRNDTLADQGNAALTLNELGVGAGITELRWLVPPVTAGTDERASVRDLVSPWVPLAVLQLLIGGLLVALWRGRRLGPPVAEPLPVVVRAAETVHGRARLYRRGQARDQAARALRAGALARIVPRLRLGEWPPPGAVVTAMAIRTGRREQELHGLLYGPAPLDDAGLVWLADALDGLVAELSR